MVDKLNLMVQAQVTSAYQCSRLCEILSEVEPLLLFKLLI